MNELNIIINLNKRKISFITKTIDDAIEHLIHKDNITNFFSSSNPNFNKLPFGEELSTIFDKIYFNISQNNISNIILKRMYINNFYRLFDNLNLINNSKEFQKKINSFNGNGNYIYSKNAILELWAIYVTESITSALRNIELEIKKKSNKKIKAGDDRYETYRGIINQILISKLKNQKVSRAKIIEDFDKNNNKNESFYITFKKWAKDSPNEFKELVFEEVYKLKKYF